MPSDREIVELERRAEAACVGSPARLAGVRRLVAAFHSERLWRFSADGHCTVLKVLGWPDGGAPRLLPKTGGEGEAGGVTIGQR